MTPGSGPKPVSGPGIALDRTTAAAATGLALATVISWVMLARQGHTMDLRPYLVAWTLMMAAMMLPSVAPLVLLHQQHRLALTAGYLVVWAALGLLPYAAMRQGFEPAVPVVLALAGIYELTPLKTACLRHCRNPATFLIQRFGRGAFRLGVEHAVWCVGCCLGLMAVLVLAASMNLLWAAVLAAVVFAQKVLPYGELSTRLTGVALLIGAIVTAI
ncbi:MAG TPA: DUF2182 domain-containing protein [Gemmatimonadaceae bacterium]|nr:DUF2182 domain-containing protein [Gemmatimonadaceae bacterium]